MRLYLDVDGVLLGCRDPKSSEVVLAAHAEDFLSFALTHFEVFWATTNCDGTSESVVRYLRPYCTPRVVALVEKIRPTQFVTLKIELFEPLTGDFLWLDDQPLQAEERWLSDRGWRDRLLVVDTRRRPHDLARALTVVRAECGGR